MNNTFEASIVLDIMIQMPVHGHSLSVQGQIRNQGRLTNALGQTISFMKSYSADVDLLSES